MGEQEKRTHKTHCYKGEWERSCKYGSDDCPEKPKFLRNFKGAYASKRIFIVRMLRWGSEENHSYVIGAWSNYEKALEEAEAHMVDRGGKYDAEILETIFDSHHCEVYRRVSWGDFDVTKYDDAR